MKDLTTEKTNEETQQTGTAESLGDIDIDELKKLGKKQLAAICRIEELPCSGKKSDLLNQLIAKKCGRSRRYVGSLTTCKVCGAPVSVKSTQKEPMEDGRVIVIRQIKCLGKNAHRYPLKEIL